MTAQTVDFRAIATPRADGRSGPEVTTALICDTLLLRSGLHRVLSGTPFAVVEEGPKTSPRLVSGTAQQPALVIVAVSQLSSHMPEMVRQAKQRHPAARIVLLADHVDLGLVTQGCEAGADGLCLTGSDPEVLITSLELIMLGESVLPGALVRSIIDGLALNPEPTTKDPDEPKTSDRRARRLSTREAEVLSSLMHGEPNKIIARQLDVTEATVKVHLKAILRKIGVTNRTQAALWAMNHLPVRGEVSPHG